jgi:hypothetical protein
VVFITEEFVKKEWPMMELQIFLKRRERDRDAGQDTFRILPVFLGLTPGACSGLKERYKKWRLSGPTKSFPDVTWEEFAELGEQLSRETGARPSDQVWRQGTRHPLKLSSAPLTQLH